MEGVHCRKASKVSPEQGEDDVISSMPDNVIANIMDRLPLKDAVATSILSPNWRLKWTLLTQLIFDEDFFITLFVRKIHFDKTNLTRLLLHLKGAVTKFVLHRSDWIFKLDDEDIHHLVMFLSRIRGFKELTILNILPTPLKLPTYLFSCLELKHLHLYKCVLSPSPCFHGFPKLLTLELNDVSIQDHKYGEVIAQCPLLETLEIWNSNLRVKLVEIAKLKNLKMLCLPLCLLDNLTMIRVSTVFQHMSLLPKLQELYLDLEKCKFLPEDFTQNPVSITFYFLGTLTIHGMDFSSVSMLSFAFRMLIGCTTLQTLRISVPRYKNDVPLPAIYPPEVDCNTMGQLKLQNVNLMFITGLENEVCLIKYILACSPMLKSFKIQLDPSIKNNDNEKYKIASKLLKLRRASPIAEVIF